MSPDPLAARGNARPNVVAYVAMAYPRLSETYITSEISRVEEAGIDVRLFALKPVEPWEQGPAQPVVERTRANLELLPDVGSFEKVPLREWLPRHFGGFRPGLRRVAARRPLALARVMGAAVAHAVRERAHWEARPPKLYIKHVLRGVALADELLRDPRVSHIHAHYAHDSTTVAWFASMLTGLPFSFTGHARDIYDEARNPRDLLRRKLMAAEFAVTCTGANVAHLKDIAPEADVQLVYHGLGEDTAALLEQAPAVDGNGKLHILGVGRLVRKKGFGVLIEACGVLAERAVPFEARIVGPDGDHADECRERIAALGLEDRVLLPGPMGQEQLVEEYRRADAFCMPCRVLSNNDRDGIPNVLVEAMASGVPVVTTPVSGIPEIVTDGDNGLMVDPDDPRALAEALIRLRGDRDLREILGTRAQDTVRERFDGRRSAERLARMFREAAA